jgi:RHS repeat-associated protein
MPSPEIDDLTTTTDYCGNIIYESNQLKYILNPEGYAQKVGNNYQYTYYVRDHLGNNARAGYQVNNFYPSGMTNSTTSYMPEQQPYKFGGKELDEMHGLNWYDQRARPFDAIIPRTPTMDPMAEKYYNISPYVQCLNNPVNAIDPTGMWIEYRDDTGSYRYNNGQWEQYQTSGKNIGQYTVYTPEQGSFLEGVLTGLNQLNENATGNDLLNFFANDDNTATIKQGTVNQADIDSASGFVYLSTDFSGSLIPTEGGVSMSPFWLDIGHELAHIQDIKTNGVPQANSPWLSKASDGVDVKTTEKYATHMENQMRADAGLLLRTHYVRQGFAGYDRSQIINNGG